LDNREAASPVFVTLNTRYNAPRVSCAIVGTSPK